MTDILDWKKIAKFKNQNDSKLFQNSMILSMFPLIGEDLIIKILTQK